MRLFMTTLVLACVLVMAGCGQKGDLYREDSGPGAEVEENEEDDSQQ